MSGRLDAAMIFSDDEEVNMKFRRSFLDETKLFMYCTTCRNRLCILLDMRHLHHFTQKNGSSVVQHALVDCACPIEYAQYFDTWRTYAILLRVFYCLLLFLIYVWYWLFCDCLHFLYIVGIFVRIWIERL